jgi:arginine deiminase
LVILCGLFIFNSVLFITMKTQQRQQEEFNSLINKFKNELGEFLTKENLGFSNFFIEIDMSSDDNKMMERVFDGEKFVSKPMQNIGFIEDIKFHLALGLPLKSDIL